MENDILKNVWPEWKVVRLIGRGSYGSVYEAERTDSNLHVRSAIKVISVPQSESEVDGLRSEGMSDVGARTYFKGVVDDFIGEISMMESLKGVQNIVSVEDYKVIEKTDEIGWDIYIRMELLIPFNTFLLRNEIDEQTMIKLGIDISTAIDLCSKNNIIHRDIKPDNIFVNSFGDFKLGDFGIAKKLEGAASNLSQKGTFQYMAPEVQSGDRYDGSVDIYSLGLVLYRLANKNRLPFMDSEKEVFTANDKVNATRRRFSGERIPAPCGVSEGFANIILKACEFEPCNRFRSAGEMKNALKALQDGDMQFFSTNELNEDTVDKTVSVRRKIKIYGNDDLEEFEGSSTQREISENVSRIQTQNSQRTENLSGSQRSRGRNYSAGSRNSNGPENSKKKIAVIVGAIAVAAAIIAAAAIIFLPKVIDASDHGSGLIYKGTETTVETETTAEMTTEPETTAAKETETTTARESETTTRAKETETTTKAKEPETTTKAKETETTTVKETETTTVPETTARSETASESSNETSTPHTNVPSDKVVYYPADTAGIDPANLNVGDVVKFGTYEQDGDTSDGLEAIEWEVIYQEEGAYLLISKYALDAQPYNTSDASDLSWDNSSLRTWLNNDFYNAAFSDADKDIIVKSDKTDDNVSLLGYDESGDTGVTYFMENAEERACYATAYAVKNGAWVTTANESSPWWLRTNDAAAGSAYMVKSTGEIGSNIVTNGITASDKDNNMLVSVRPIIWVK